MLPVVYSCLGCCSYGSVRGLVQVLGSGLCFLVLVVAVVRLKPGTLLLLILRKFFLVAADSHVHLFVADVIKSFDTVDRGILDRVLSSLGLPGWFRHAYLEYHAHVRLRFKLASGLGRSWDSGWGYPSGLSLEYHVPCSSVSALV